MDAVEPDSFMAGEGRLDSTVIYPDMRKRSTRNATGSTYEFTPTPNGSGSTDTPETSQLPGSIPDSSQTSRISSWITRTRLALYDRIESAHAPSRADIEGILDVLRRFLTTLVSEIFCLVEKVLTVLYLSHTYLRAMLNYCRTPLALITIWYFLVYIGSAYGNRISETVSDQWILKNVLCYVTSDGLAMCGVNSSSRTSTPIPAPEQIRRSTASTQKILERVMTIENMPYAMLDSQRSLRSLKVAVEESELKCKKDLSPELHNISEVSEDVAENLAEYLVRVSNWVRRTIHATDRVAEKLKDIIKAENDGELYSWSQVLLYPLGLHSKPNWNVAEASAAVYEEYFQDLREMITPLQDLGAKLHLKVKNTEDSVESVNRLSIRERYHMVPKSRALRLLGKLVKLSSKEEELLDRVDGEWNTVDQALVVILNGFKNIRQGLKVGEEEIYRGHLRMGKGNGEQLQTVINDIRMALEPLTGKKKEEERQMEALLDQMGKVRQKS